MSLARSGGAHSAAPSASPRVSTTGSACTVRFPSSWAFRNFTVRGYNQEALDSHLVCDRPDVDRGATGHWNFDPLAVSRVGP